VQTNLTGTMLGCKTIGKVMMGNSRGGTFVSMHLCLVRKIDEI
jgi:hypothetical protein